VAHGYTGLQDHDRVTVFANARAVLAVRQWLTGQLSEDIGIDETPVRHRDFTIPASAICRGRMVRELTLPPNCIIVSIDRDHKIIVPHGDTILQAGDVVEVFGLEDELADAKLCLVD
jgi:NhaP-type Na+/H+ and K+/H+ antiporter